VPLIAWFASQVACGRDAPDLQDRKSFFSASGQPSLEPRVGRNGPRKIVMQNRNALSLAGNWSK
jgi:hypothetical protein